MGYNNQNNGGYNRQNYGQNNYQNNNYNRNQNSNQQQPQHKKSGAVYTTMKNGKFEGETCVNAWRATKDGLVKASAFPVDGVVHVGKDKGHEFMRYVVNVTQGINTQTFWCLMRLDTKKIVIKELGLVISPNGQGVTRNGKRVTGFFGKNFRS